MQLLINAVIDDGGFIRPLAIDGQLGIVQNLLVANPAHGLAGQLDIRFAGQPKVIRPLHQPLDAQAVCHFIEEVVAAVLQRQNDILPAGMVRKVGRNPTFRRTRAFLNVFVIGADVVYHGIDGDLPLHQAGHCRRHLEDGARCGDGRNGVVEQRCRRIVEQRIEILIRNAAGKQIEIIVWIGSQRQDSARLDFHDDRRAGFDEIDLLFGAFGQLAVVPLFISHICPAFLVHLQLFLVILLDIGF